MEANNIAELIFEKWVASLKTRDRSKTGTPQNFDDLFSELKMAGVLFAEAHKLLDRAIKAHYPSSAVKKNVWNKFKKYIEVSETEFYTEWLESIKNSGTDAFYANYPLNPNDDDDGEPKVYGNMSVKEYRMQRRYADSFPRLNTDDLVRQMKERQAQLTNINLDNVLGDAQNDKQ